MDSKSEAQNISRIHRRQFVFSDIPIVRPAGWCSISLGDGFFLHHCPWLNVRTAVDSSGQQWALLGHAFEVTAVSSHDPVASIIRSRTQDVPALVEAWSGRWLLLCSSALITDAAALLGVYILEDDRGVFISSSLALLSQLTSTSIRDSRVLGWYGFNWFPGPLCKLAGVRRLLPDQIYSPKSRAINFFNRLTPPVGISVKKAAEEISHGLAHVFRAMSQQDPRKSLILTLTGGLDSRTTFSVLQASGIPYSALTLEHPRISSADTTLPAIISAAHGVTHRYIAGDKPLRKKVDEYDLHTFRCVVDGDRQFYARGSYENLGPQNWLIRSGCWELGRRYFHRTLRGLSLEEVMDRPDRLMLRFKTYFGTRASADSLREWAHWRLAHPIAVPWQDLFYRDQRLGCWASSIEQSLDLLDPVSILPVNCDRFYGLMLGSRDISGSKTTLQYEIIEQCVPDLAAVSVNPPGGRYFAAKNRLSWVAAVISGESNNLLRSFTHR